MSATRVLPLAVITVITMFFFLALYLSSFIGHSSSWSNISRASLLLDTPHITIFHKNLLVIGSNTDDQVVKDRNSLNIFRFHRLCCWPDCQQAWHQLDKRLAGLVGCRSSLLLKIKYAVYKIMCVCRPVKWVIIKMDFLFYFFICIFITFNQIIIIYMFFILSKKSHGLV